MSVKQMINARASVVLAYRLALQVNAAMSVLPNSYACYSVARLLWG